MNKIPSSLLWCPRRRFLGPYYNGWTAWNHIYGLYGLGILDCRRAAEYGDIRNEQGGVAQKSFEEFSELDFVHLAAYQNRYYSGFVGVFQEVVYYTLAPEIIQTHCRVYAALGVFGGV